MLKLPVLLVSVRLIQWFFSFQLISFLKHNLAYFALVDLAKLPSIKTKKYAEPEKMR